MCAFYSDQPSATLRFGDVVTGFQFAALHMDSPGPDEKGVDLKIHVTRPRYFAVMTPCCSIELKSISLAPLVQVRHRFFDFPPLAAELTKINSPMPPETPFTEEHWKTLSAEKQQEVLGQGNSYVFDDCFVYEANAIFPAYVLKNKKISLSAVGQYMVDFRSIARIECSQIERNHDAPSGMKLLELSVQTRGQLRDKLAHFFGRVPAEDAA
ncbi:MAG: hypothetical protein WBG19_05640 [Thermoplasmata archaeon]